jgi:hypothetical protein
VGTSFDPSQIYRCTYPSNCQLKMTTAFRFHAPWAQANFLQRIGIYIKKMAS